MDRMTLLNENENHDETYNLIEVKNGRYIVKFKSLSVPIDMNEFLYSQLISEKFQSWFRILIVKKKVLEKDEIISRMFFDRYTP